MYFPLSYYTEMIDNFRSLMSEAYRNKHTKEEEEEAEEGGKDV